MKLLFIENRYTTRVYEAVAKELIKLGHEIHWLVQNPVFSPRIGHLHVMAFPSAKFDKGGVNESYEWLARTDRGVLHFGATGSHYPHYDALIAENLEIIQPDVIFGEATEFHELLTIRHAKVKGIPYLSPNVTRYPADRLAFMAYDTLEPVGGDGSHLSDEIADEMLAAIRERKVVPSYMRPVASNKHAMAVAKVVDKLRITWGWLRGERYITPSPRRKLALNSAQREARAQWELLAAEQHDRWVSLKASAQPWVLYALQMQPEGNIDVWGTPWNDQAVIIQRAAESLAHIGATLVVKPNPKSKYEMNSQLIQAVCTAPNVLALPHATPMADVFPHAPLVIAVTGTVLMECIIAGKPIASLGNHAMTRYRGVNAINEPEGVATLLQEFLRNELATSHSGDARELLQSLHASSYPATMWVPVLQPRLGKPDALDALIQAFTHVLFITEPKLIKF